METLFIVASTRLLKFELATVAREGRIGLTECEVVLLEEEPWEMISGKILDLIAPGACVVRVACHNGGPCLSTHNLHSGQQEHADKNVELKNELRRKGREENVDLGVWGFHHVPGTPIYEAFKRLKDLQGVPVERHTAIRSDLLKAFRIPTHITTYDRLSVFKHRLVGLFSPINVQLQTIGELPHRGEQAALADRIAAGLEEKRQVSAQLVRDARSLVKAAGGATGTDILKLDRLLKHIETLVAEGFALFERPREEWLAHFASGQPAESRLDVTFHQWLRRLDQALRDFRDVTRKNEQQSTRGAYT